MHERRFHGDISRLRSPERLARLEVDRVVDLCLQGGAMHRVLDVGTGTAVFAEAFHKQGINVEGLDANPEMLLAARDLVPGVNFQEGIAETLPYPDTAFDMVFLGLLLHETDDHIKAVREAARVAARKVAILEWPYQQQDIGPGLDERLTEEQVAALAADSGLVVKNIFSLQTLVLYILEK